MYIWIHIFIHSSTGGHLGCIHIFAFISLWSNAAMNMEVQIFPRFDSISFRYILRSGVMDHTVVLFLIFWGSSILFSIMAAPIYIVISNTWRFPFLYILTNPFYILFFLLLVILKVVRWYHIVILVCIFLMISDFEHLFICLLAICVSLWKYVYSNFLPILNWIICSCYGFVRVLCIFWILILCKINCL